MVLHRLCYAIFGQHWMGMLMTYWLTERASSQIWSASGCRQVLLLEVVNENIRWQRDNELKLLVHNEACLLYLPDHVSPPCSVET